MVTRRSPPFHHNESTQEADKKVQNGTPTAHGSPSQHSHVFSGLWSMGSVAGWAEANHLPSEQGGPSGEGTSSNGTSVLLATAGRDSIGELPKSSPEYPGYGSVMILYNTCYPILMAALLVMAPNEALEVAEKQEESSDYKCAICEQFKDNPNP